MKAIKEIILGSLGILVLIGVLAGGACMASAFWGGVLGSIQWVARLIPDGYGWPVVIGLVVLWLWSCNETEGER